MSTKLTLTIDKFIIEKAKKYARDQDRSLSDLVGSYLKTVSDNETTVMQDMSAPIIQSLRGSFSTRGLEGDQKSYKKSLADQLAAKHLSE